MPVSAPVISTTGVLVMSQRYLLLAASASARPLGFLVSPSSATEWRILVLLNLIAELLLPPLRYCKFLPPLLRRKWRRA
jgi:hypothetical protein